MSRPWEAEVELARDEAAALLASQFPALTAAGLEPLGSGWDNVAFLVNGELVFRFPKKAAAATLIETESRVLPRLANRLSLRIPDPEWIGEPSGRFPWRFIGYRLLPGQPGCGARLSRNERTRIAPVLGRFLAELHSVPLNGLELPGDVLDRRNFKRRIPLMVERLDAIHSHGLIETPAPWLRLFEELEHVPPTVRDSIVHGDLYARHLLIDEERTLTGVIDWGDVHAGDPAMDLMMMFGFLPGPARRPFESAYGPVDEAVLRVARLRAAFHAVSVTWYGIELPDPDLAHEGRLALDFVLED